MIRALVFVAICAGFPADAKFDFWRLHLSSQLPFEWVEFPPTSPEVKVAGDVLPVAKYIEPRDTVVNLHLGYQRVSFRLLDGRQFSQIGEIARNSKFDFCDDMLSSRDVLYCAPIVCGFEGFDRTFSPVTHKRQNAPGGYVFCGRLPCIPERDVHGDFVVSSGDFAAFKANVCSKLLLANIAGDDDGSIGGVNCPLGLNKRPSDPIEACTSYPDREEASGSHYESPYRHIALSLEVFLGAVVVAFGLFYFDSAFRKVGTRHVDTEGLYAGIGALGLLAGFIIIGHGMWGLTG